MFICPLDTIKNILMKRNVINSVPRNNGDVSNTSPIKDVLITSSSQNSKPNFVKLDFDVSELALPDFYELNYGEAPIIDTLVSTPSASSSRNFYDNLSEDNSSSRGETTGLLRGDTTTNELESSSISRSELDPNTQIEPLTTGKHSELYEMVVNSDAYIKAHELFSTGQYGSMFLTRLEMIPTSVLEADKTIWDSVGLSNNYEDVLRASYQRCIEQIQNLVSEYYQYINSLPSTQVQQLNQAGINSAVTGQGVSSSQLNASQPTTDPSVLSSTNSGTYLSSLASLLTTGIPNALSASVNMFSTLRQLNDNRSNTLANLWNSLSSLGYNMAGYAFNSWDDVSTFQSDFSAHSSKAEIQQLEDAINIYRKQIDVNVASEYGRSLGESASKRGLTLEAFYSELADSWVEEWFFTQQNNFKLAEYKNTLISNLDPADESSYITAQREFGKAQADYDKQLIELRRTKINSWVKRISESNDPVVKQAFVEYLMGVDDTYAGKIGGFVKDTASSLVGGFIGGRFTKGSLPSNSYGGWNPTTTF